MNKKIMLLAIFFVNLLAVSVVSASDNITDDALGLEENDNGELDDSNCLTMIDSADEKDVQLSVDDGDVLSNSSYSGDMAANSTKSPTHVKVSSFKAKIGSKHSIRAYITYDSGSGDCVSGIVEFKINGKTYKTKVKDGNVTDDSSSGNCVSGIAEFKINGKTYKTKVKDGIATIKVKLPLKVKTLKCSVKFLGDNYYSDSSAKFKIKLSKSNVAILKKNRHVKIGKYTIKLTPKQYKSLVKSFKKEKSKSIKVKTNYKYKVRKSYYKEVKHYKTLKTVKYTALYEKAFKKMRKHGWEKVSEHTFTKKNPQYKEGIGLSAYTYSISKWVKPSYHLAYKTKYYPVNAKITMKKSSSIPTIKIYTHGKTLKNRYLAIK